MAFPYVVAALVALVLGGIEQHNRLRAPFTLLNSAWSWWLLRLLLEAGIGAAALAIIRHADRSLGNSALIWLAAGAAGPAAVRLRILDLEARPIGIATIYEPIRGFLEGNLDSRCAECLTSWLNLTVLPGILHIDPEPAELAKYASDFVRGRASMSREEALQETRWLGAVRDGSESRRVKLETLTEHLVVELRAYNLVGRFLTEHGVTGGGPPRVGKLRRLRFRRRP